MPLFGYARVSTRDQDLAAQDGELRAAGCAKVFKEKASGAKSDGPELAKVFRARSWFGCSWRFRIRTHIDRECRRHRLSLRVQLLLLHRLHRLANATIEQAIDLMTRLHTRAPGRWPASCGVQPAPIADRDCCQKADLDRQSPRHAAAPPSGVMNSRRFTISASRASDRKDSTPQ
jgi:hypothetical protein